MADDERVPPLALECRIFTKYLIGEDPADDILAAYDRAHQVSAVTTPRTPLRSLDRALLRVAHAGPFWSRVADGYAAVFAKSSFLRRKLVLLVAILESRGETASRIDSADVVGSRGAWVLRTIGQVGAGMVILGVAALLIVPLRAWYAVRGAVRSHASSDALS